MTYYNTNENAGIYLREAWTQTAKQDELIYQLFADNPDQGAINTLTKDGKLTKTRELQKSSYGKNAHIWRLNDQTT